MRWSPSGQIQIEADDVSPARVEAIVLETARVFEEQHAARNQGIPTQDRAIVSILDRPTAARLVWPQTRVIVGAAALLGLFVGALLAFALHYLDDTLKTAGDVERTLGTITLGQLPRPTALLASADHRPSDRSAGGPGVTARKGGAHRMTAVRDSSLNGAGLVSMQAPRSPAAEAYRC